MNSGVKIRNVPASSIFFSAGLRPGDIVSHVNGELVEDELDFKFFTADDFLELCIRRNGKKLIVNLQREEGSFLDVELYEKPINICRNRCIFCFIDQMPKGLRSGLYIKDEDFKHSFFNGNYVTLSSATNHDLQKVAKLGISPLYISVHATDTAVRNKMLRNSKAPPIMEQLSFLKKAGVAFHTQIVLCKGYNDGETLLRTIKDLFSFKEYLLSIAVVPVGLTRFRKFPLAPVDQECAQWVCSEVEKKSDEYATKDGFRRLFLADEFFIKANHQIPSRKYYEDYPQIENGVGLVCQLLEEWKLCKRKMKSGKIKPSYKTSSLVVTSCSAYPFLKKIIDDAQKIHPKLQMNVVAVDNIFFGETVTVAGLLTAKDIIRTIKRETNGVRSGMQVFIPQIMFNYAGYTLDGYSLQRIRKETQLEINIASSLEDIFTGELSNKG